MQLYFLLSTSVITFDMQAASYCRAAEPASTLSSLTAWVKMRRRQRLAKYLSCVRCENTITCGRTVIGNNCWGLSDGLIQCRSATLWLGTEWQLCLFICIMWLEQIWLIRFESCFFFSKHNNKPHAAHLLLSSNPCSANQYTDVAVIVMLLL